jgi:homoprotocatechuate degradation regulator HpaR
MRALQNSLPLKLLQAREVVMDKFRPHLHAHGITEQQWRVLRALAETTALDAGELARRVCLLMPSLSRIIRDLAAQGLLVRRNDPRDRRVAIVGLTEKGRDLFEVMSRESETIYSAIEATLGADVCARLMAELDAVVGKLSAVRQGEIEDLSAMKQLKLRKRTAGSQHR